LRKLAAECDSLKASLQEEAKAHDEAMRELTIERDGVRAEYAETEQRLRTKEGVVRKLTVECDSLKVSLQEEAKVHDEAVRRHIAERDGLRAENTEREQLLEAKEGTLRKLAAECDSLKASLQEKANAHDEVVRSHVIERDRLRAESEENQQALQAKERAVTRLAAMLTEREAHARMLRAVRRGLRIRIQQRSRLLKATEEAVSRLRVEADSLRAGHQEKDRLLEVSVSMLTAEREASNADVARLRGDNEELAKTIAMQQRLLDEIESVQRQNMDRFGNSLVDLRCRAERHLVIRPSIDELDRQIGETEAQEEHGPSQPPQPPQPDDGQQAEDLLALEAELQEDIDRIFRDVESQPDDPEAAEDEDTALEEQAPLPEARPRRRAQFDRPLSKRPRGDPQHEAAVICLVES